MKPKKYYYHLTKFCETNIEQTQEKTEETLEFKMINSRETYHSNQTISIEGSWMIGLTDLEVYNSSFNITKKIELYKIFDEIAGIVSYIKVRDEIEKDLVTSDITATDFQDEIIAPNIILKYREQVTKRMKDGKYMLILAMYVDCIFHDFESFLRTEIDLVEDGVCLVVDEYNSKFSNYELTPGTYTFRDISEAFLNNLLPEYRVYNNSVDVEYDDINLKTKLVARPSNIAIRFDEKSFLVLSLVLIQVGFINTIVNSIIRKL